MAARYLCNPVWYRAARLCVFAHTELQAKSNRYSFARDVVLMFKSIEIDNFKSFGSKTKVELAPITLILGQNSAGKSSLLHALTLLKQTREGRDVGAPLLPRAEDGIIDLGSFHELLFDHDTKRALRIGLQLVPDKGDASSRYYMESFGFDTPASLGLAVSFIRKNAESEVALQDLEIVSTQPDARIAQFTARPLSKQERRAALAPVWTGGGLRRLRGRANVTGAFCSDVTDSKDIWLPMYRAWHERRGRVRAQLESDVNFQHDSLFGKDEQGIPDMFPPEQAYRDAIDFYSKDFGFTDFVDRMSAWCRSTVVGVDGFIPHRLRGPWERSLPEVASASIGPSRPAGRGRLSLPLLDVGGLATRAGRITDDMLEKLFPMGPWRRPPQRWYIFTGTSPLDVGYRGDLLPDLLYRHPELVNQANKWLSRLDIGYKLIVTPIGKGDSDLFEVRLADATRANNINVALPDVGFGVSQILPFIVQSLAAKERIISIEQPEVHIHPRLQADLGELIAAAIRAPYSHQYLIETHSEHLVLRIQKLVREGKLRPEDVAVIFVSRGAEGSTIKRLVLDGDGDFVDEWPGGFFPERLRELR